MEKVKQFFSASNGLGRTVRTFLQSFVGIVGFVYGLISIPGVQDYLVHNNVVAMGTLAAVIGVVAGLHNATEKLLKWLLSD